MPTLYETLGLEPSCSAEDIRKAFRKLAKQYHPDAGGDAEKFKEVSFAYEVLSDPEKRKRYDANGQTLSGSNRAITPVEQAIAGMIHEAFENEHVDPIKFMCGTADRKRENAKSKLRKLESEAGKKERRLAHFKSKCSETSNTKAFEFICEVLEAQIIELKSAATATEDEIAFHCEVLSYLNDLKCPADSSEYARGNLSGWGHESMRSPIRWAFTD